MTDLVNIPKNEIPGEMYHLLRLQKQNGKDTNKYLPIVYVDELSQRIRDLVIVNSTDKSADVEIKYEPMSWGKLRLFLQFSTALRSMGELGFKVSIYQESLVNNSIYNKTEIEIKMYSTTFNVRLLQEKDTDEVKGIFADTNMVLLMVTFGVSAIHLLFDFLAFKNDISFWRGKTNMVSFS